jgi:hypothetical protein
MAMYTSDVVYEGEETIVVSMDIGTTHSKLIISTMEDLTGRRRRYVLPRVSW